jgi:uncharacterized protein YneF (UPF0154 family)
MSEIYGNIVIIMIYLIVFAIGIIGNYIVTKQEDKEIEKIIYKNRFAEKMRNGTFEILGERR